MLRRGVGLRRARGGRGRPCGWANRRHAREGEGEPGLFSSPSGTNPDFTSLNFCHPRTSKHARGGTPPRRLQGRSGLNPFRAGPPSRSPICPVFIVKHSWGKHSPPSSYLSKKQKVNPRREKEKPGLEGDPGRQTAWRESPRVQEESSNCTPASTPLSPSPHLGLSCSSLD